MENLHIYIYCCYYLFSSFLLVFQLQEEKEYPTFRRSDFVGSVNARRIQISSGCKILDYFVAIGLFSVLLARPQFGSKLETVKRKGVEVIIALDISNSMLAQDVQPSRLEKAKRLISRLVDELDNDKVGMIVFAGDAFTQLPITSDYISAKMFLESISPSLISKQGTAIGEAINLAARSFTPQEG